MKGHIFELRRKIWKHDWSSQLYTQLKQPWNSSLKKFWTYDLCGAGAVLYQLSYQANWELVTLCVLDIPVDSKN